MWLLYLRFDDRGTVTVCHIRTGSKGHVRELVELAQQHGLTPTSRLVEYAAFPIGVTDTTTVLADVSHEYLRHAQFVERWHTVHGALQMRAA